MKHPLYAGAFGYGRRKRYGNKLKQNAVKKHLPPEQWKVLIKDIHPAYITWEIYEDIQQRLHSNDTVGEGRAAPREGTALLAGIVKCAHCGRKLASSYPGNGHPVYRCGRHRTMAGATPCYSTIRCATLDEFVESKILEVLSPAGVELSFQVIEDEVARRVQFDTLYEQRVAQARYAVEDQVCGRGLRTSLPSR